MKLLQLQINEKLALAATIAAFAWLMGLYFALQPIQLSGLPEFISAGCLEWVSTILAVAAGLWCLQLLSQAVRSRGVAWWAYAIGIVAAAGTILVAVIVAYALISS